MAFQKFLRAHAEEIGQTEQIPRPDNNTSASGTAVSAAAAGKTAGRGGKKASVYGFHTHILHHGNSGVGHDLSCLGAAYALLHPEQKGKARQRQNLTRVFRTVLRGAEQADNVRGSGKLAERTERGQPPDFPAYRMHREYPVSRFQQIAPHMFHR